MRTTDPIIPAVKSSEPVAVAEVKSSHIELPEHVVKEIERIPEAKKEQEPVEEHEKPDVQQPEVQQDFPSDMDVPKEEKASGLQQGHDRTQRKNEKKASVQQPSKLGIYNGKGRRHTEKEIDEILDFYVLTGQLPDYVSERQKYSYRHHKKLEERRKILGK